MVRMTRTIVTFVLVFLLGWGGVPGIGMARTLPSQSIQPYLDRVIQNVTEFKLQNGLKFIVLERHQAPVVSFVTYADVGGVDEPKGKTGVAHFLEHLAFKGTTRIGTQNFQAEKPLLDKLDQLALQIKAAKEQKKDVQALQAEFDRVETEATKLVRQNEFGRIIEQAGGVGLDATTFADGTRYAYSFPSNKLELWMSLESERYLDPVFREFYKEKAVVLEERRLRTENAPIGRLIEALLDTAFKVHPYSRPVIGYRTDLDNLTSQDVKAFFEKYYVPNNLTIAIVGDVNPVQVKRLAQTYFGRYKARPEPPKVTAVEPPQTAPREVTLKLQSQPVYLEAYHRPSINDPDDAMYKAITSILTGGRTSRLYKSLVEEKKVALAVEGSNGFPGDKFPSLTLLEAYTAPGRSIEEVQSALRAEINRLKTQPVSTEELDRVKTQARAGLLRALNSNLALAVSLAEYDAKTGSWRSLFKQIDAIVKITPADIQRVANATFTDSNRTIARILPQG